MNMFRTTARVGLAALSISLGATLATAADKKPIKPAAPPVVKKPNGWSFPASTGWSLGASNPTSANKPHTPANDAAKKPNGFSWGLAQTGVTNKARDAASGLATGRTQQPDQSRTKAPSNLGDTGTHEVGHVKNPKLDLKNVKPVNSGGGVSAQNDTGTRSGGSLTGEGLIDIAKGIGKVISPKGNTHDGFKTIAEGAKKVQTGTNGDPADNGDKLTEEGKGGDNNGGSGGGSNGGSSGGGSGK
jgi:hypothetical protein